MRTLVSRKTRLGVIGEEFVQFLFTQAAFSCPVGDPIAKALLASTIPLPTPNVQIFVVVCPITVLYLRSRELFNGPKGPAQRVRLR